MSELLVSYAAKSHALLQVSVIVLLAYIQTTLRLTVQCSYFCDTFRYSYGGQQDETGAVPGGSGKKSAWRPEGAR